jgi:hypothetical protein
VVLRGPRANGELVPKLHVSLHASHAALPILTSMSPLSSFPHIKIKMSPYAALPRFNVWNRGSNWVQWDPAQLLFLLHFSSLASSLLNVLPPPKHTFTRRTSGHSLGTFIAVSLALFTPVKCSVSHYPPTFSSLSFGFKRLSKRPLCDLCCYGSLYRHTLQSHIETTHERL